MNTNRSNESRLFESSRKIERNRRNEGQQRADSRPLGVRPMRIPETMEDMFWKMNNGRINFSNAKSNVSSSAPIKSEPKKINPLLTTGDEPPIKDLILDNDTTLKQVSADPPRTPLKEKIIVQKSSFSEGKDNRSMNKDSTNRKSRTTLKRRKLSGGYKATGGSVSTCPARSDSTTEDIPGIKPSSSRAASVEYLEVEDMIKIENASPNIYRPRIYGKDDHKIEESGDRSLSAKDESVDKINYNVPAVKREFLSDEILARSLETLKLISMDATDAMTCQKIKLALHNSPSPIAKAINKKPYGHPTRRLRQQILWKVLENEIRNSQMDQQTPVPGVPKTARSESQYECNSTTTSSDLKRTPSSDVGCNKDKPGETGLSPQRGGLIQQADINQLLPTSSSENDPVICPPTEVIPSQQSNLLSIEEKYEGNENVNSNKIIYDDDDDDIEDSQHKRIIKDPKAYNNITIKLDSNEEGEPEIIELIDSTDDALIIDPTAHHNRSYRRPTPPSMLSEEEMISRSSATKTTTTTPTSNYIKTCSNGQHQRGLNNNMKKATL